MSVELRRLTWVGPLAVLSSIAAVSLIRFVAVVLLQPDPTFMPLTSAPSIIDTAVFVTLAVLVFRRIALIALDPIRTFRIVAGIALLISFTPDIALAFSHRFSWPNALALMAMHVAAWAACVPILTRLTVVDREKED